MPVIWEARRVYSLQMLAAGYRPEQVALAYAVTRQAVYLWKRRYMGVGYSGIAARRNRGGPSKLSPAQKAELLSAAAEGGMSYSGCVDFIRSRFGVSYTPNYIGQFLARLRNPDAYRKPPVSISLPAILPLVAARLSQPTPNRYPIFSSPPGPWPPAPGPTPPLWPSPYPDSNVGPPPGPPGPEPQPPSPYPPPDPYQPPPPPPW